MTTAELTKWLRENSSGAYRPAADAADLIEKLSKENGELKRELILKQEDYKKLATHHNQHCTCNEIY